MHYNILYVQWICQSGFWQGMQRISEGCHQVHVKIFQQDAKQQSYHNSEGDTGNKNAKTNNSAKQFKSSTKSREKMEKSRNTELNQRDEKPQNSPTATSRISPIDEDKSERQESAEKNSIKIVINPTVRTRTEESRALSPTPYERVMGWVADMNLNLDLNSRYPNNPQMNRSALDYNSPFVLISGTGTRRDRDRPRPLCRTSNQNVILPQQRQLKNAMDALNKRLSVKLPTIREEFDLLPCFHGSCSGRYY